jgi:hypothetical protein
MSQFGYRNATMRVAISHDWLNTMRGGKSVWKVFARCSPALTCTRSLRARSSFQSDQINERSCFPLNDLPPIERIYRYCLSLFPNLIESFDLRDYGLILSQRLQSEPRAARRKNISNFAS